MASKSFSSILQELSDQYYNHCISFEQYRAERRRLINEITRHYNDPERAYSSALPEAHEYSLNIDDGPVI